jgi:hypothetical protein
MQDDWALYSQIINKSTIQPTTIPTKQNGSSSLSLLRNIAVNDRIEELEMRLAKERDVIPGMITTGTVTLVYAPSGAGKTVWILGNLFQSIRNNLCTTKGQDGSQAWHDYGYSG